MGLVVVLTLLHARHGAQGSSVNMLGRLWQSVQFVPVVVPQLVPWRGRGLCASPPPASPDRTPGQWHVSSLYMS